MRSARIKAEGAGYYHVMSRVIERRMALGEREKEYLCRLMRKVEAFSGVQILTYTILTNHFHVLLYVPEQPEISDEELISRLRILYSDSYVDQYAQSLQEARAAGNDAYAETLRQKYLYRMNEVSEFMKTLKQRFSIWYNSNHGKRRGTLWEERFKSILVEGSENALIMMASYIDLNPVRAGIVKDPKDYRYSGYGEAVAGNKKARDGLRAVMLTYGDEKTGWGQVSHKYRKLLYMRGEHRGVNEEGKPIRGVFSTAQVEDVLAKGGTLTMSEVLRCRVRYFTDGVVLGGKEFVEAVFRKHRDEFGIKRQDGARAMKSADWGGMCTMRDLRLQVITANSAIA